MPEYEIKGSSNSVTYGMNDDAGIYMTVRDTRLKQDNQASEQVNQVAKMIDAKEGTGTYFGLHTGAKGPGLQVSKEVIQVYLKRFGVTDEQIQTMTNANKKPVPQQKCHVCRTMTSKSCQKCMAVFYCSVKCQTGDWGTS